MIIFQTMGFGKRNEKKTLKLKATQTYYLDI